jgi:hypothetical protein
MQRPDLTEALDKIHDRDDKTARDARQTLKRSFDHARMRLGEPPQYILSRPASLASNSPEEVGDLEWDDLTFRYPEGAAVKKSAKEKDTAGQWKTVDDWVERIPPKEDEEVSVITTRSGRIVRQPDRYTPPDFRNTRSSRRKVDEGLGNVESEPNTTGLEDNENETRRPNPMEEATEASEQEPKAAETTTPETQQTEPQVQENTEANEDTRPLEDTDEPMRSESSIGEDLTQPDNPNEETISANHEESGIHIPLPDEDSQSVLDQTTELEEPDTVRPASPPAAEDRDQEEGVEPMEIDAQSENRSRTGGQDSVEPMDTQSVRTRISDVTMRTVGTRLDRTQTDTSSSHSEESRQDESSEHSEDMNMDVNWVDRYNLRLYLNEYE